MKEAIKITQITSDDMTNLVLDENQIEKHKIPLEELFYLKFTDKVIGPVWTDNLKEFLKSHLDQIEENVQIRSFNGTSWSMLFEHPLFNRRRPRVIKDATSSISQLEKFHILENGTIQGPYNLSTIKNKIQKNELFLTDVVSTDAGMSWKKMYKFEVFDRRENQSSLPETPSQLNQPEKIEIFPLTKEFDGQGEIADLYKGKPKLAGTPVVKNAISKSKDMMGNRPVIILISLMVAFLFLVIIFDMLSNTNTGPNETDKKITSKSIKHKKNQKSFASTVNPESNISDSKLDEDSNVQDIPRPAYSRTRAIFQREKELGNYKNTWVKDVASNPTNHMDESDADPEHSNLNNGVSEDSRDYGEIGGDAGSNTREGYLEKLDQASEDSEQAPAPSPAGVHE